MAAQDPCPLCALREQQATLTAESIRKAAEAQPFISGLTTPAAEYERRLAACSSCPSQQGGILCAECGSYTAYRARLLKATCPYPAGSRW